MTYIRRRARVWELVVEQAAARSGRGIRVSRPGVSITDPFVRLRAYAYANDIQLSDVARDIVARRLRLFPDPDLGDNT